MEQSVLCTSLYSGRTETTTIRNVHVNKAVFSYTVYRVILKCAPTFLLAVPIVVWRTYNVTRLVKNPYRTICNCTLALTLSLANSLDSFGPGLKHRSHSTGQRYRSLFYRLVTEPNNSP